MKKLLTLILCLFMLVSMVVGCQTGSTSTDTDGSKPVGSTDSGNTETEEPVETLVPDDLPGNLDFDGTVIRVTYREDSENYFVGNNEEGEIVAEAIYKANSRVEERLDVKREWKPLQVNILTREIVKSIMSGDDLFDIVSVDQYYGSEYCAQGLFLDLSDAPYIDFEKPWYYKEYMDSLSLGEGTIFYIAGDVFPVDMMWTSAIFWNKSVYKDVIDTDPLSLYRLVDAGDWTFDRYNEMVRTAYADIDKTNTITAGDRFGTIGSNHACEHLSYSMGMTVTEKNDSGYYDVVVDTERNDSITELIRSHYYDNIGFYLYDVDIEGADFPISKFANDECLFAQQFFVHVLSETVRAMRSEFGVVPLPKYDDTQENYIGTIHNSAFFVALPVNVNMEKYDAICALIEAQGSENYRSVRQVFFEDALKVKYNRDDENAEYTVKMIDLICNNYKVDFAWVYSRNCQDLGRIIYKAIEGGNSLSQTYGQDADIIRENLNDLFNAFEEFKSQGKS